MANFKVGDVVQLKSGGPKMTVANPEAYGGVIQTTWFAGAKLEHGGFPPSTLQAYVAEEKKK